MGAIKDLFASERGFFALAIVIAATVLTGLGNMTVDTWQSFTMTIFGIYVGGKTITGAAEIIKRGSDAPTTPVVAADPAAPAAPALAVGSGG
jgi:hypothetical protein